MKKVYSLGIIIFLVAIAGLYFGPDFIKEEPVAPIRTYTASVLPQKMNDPYPQVTPMGFSLACAREPYEPVCGAVEIQCITTPCNPIEESFPNACAAKERNAKVLYEGFCEKDKPKEETINISVNRKYKSHELDVCARIRFSCEETLIPFSDETGCGCEDPLTIDAPEKKKNTTEEEKEPERIYYNGCPQVIFGLECPEGYETFSELSECGCEKIKNIETTEPEPLKPLEETIE